MKHIKIALIVFLIPFIVYGLITVWNKNGLTNTVEAAGSLTVTYLGVPLGSPIFNVVNMIPGGPVQTRTIKVKNGGKNTTQVYVRGIKKGPTGQTDPKLETALNLDIYEGSEHIYSNKLSKFFSDSKDKKGIRLENIKKGKTENFDFKVNFPSTAGNEYQNKSVVFDITFADNNGEVKGDHDERGDHDNDHDDKKDNKKKIKDELKKFEDKCKSAINKLLKRR